MENAVVLALETSSLVSSIAVLKEDKLLAELNIESTKHHSELLVPHIEELLKMASIEKSGLSAIAVSTGPGSFTGLRIGLATAKAMAYVLNIPVIGVSTLKGLAWNLRVEGALLCPLMDAQKGNVYTALYEVRNGEFAELWNERVESLEWVLAEARRNPKMMLLGEGNNRLVRKIEEYGLSSQRPAPHLYMPRAASIGFAAMERILAGEADSLMEVVPNYIRRSEAEELWEKKQAKSEQ